MDPTDTTAAGNPSASLPGTYDRPRGESTTSSAPPPAPGQTADDAQRLAREGASQLRREAHDLRDTARQAVGGAAEQIKGAAAGATEQARQTANQLTQQLREKGATFIDQQKGRAAEILGDCVAATRRAAEKLHQSDDHNLAGYADAAAARLDSVGNYLRDRDGRQLVHDVADLARRRPEWVLGGAFVVGLAVARFLKASRPEGAAYGSYRYEPPRGGMGGGGQWGYQGEDYRPQNFFAAGRQPPTSPATAGEPFGGTRPEGETGFGSTTPGSAGLTGTTVYPPGLSSIAGAAGTGPVHVGPARTTGETTTPPTSTTLPARSSTDAPISDREVH